ncbi:MAG: phosphatidate cytidylyltransferase [Lachnospiraceae bacterium]|jgi:phosphatidate cytidylyltransferase|nr:phosphatidate cytidylyltransferase [Lachnospiraceae bacterium]MCI9132743.1 phosphatidate cytidylyltransferase [Lachnospiraceae bacterium]
MKAFMTRLTSGIVLLAMIISVGLLGGWVLFAFTLTISLIGLWEFCRVFHLEKKSLGLLGLLFTVIYYLCVRNRHVSMETGMVVLLSYLICAMAVYVFTFPKYKTEEIMAAVFGMFYVTVMLSFIYLTREIPLEGVEGKFLFFLIFICSWGCDTCAYAVGMLLGRHKLAPVLSPKKSVEGGIGGVVGAALLGFLYGKFFMSHGGVCALICAVGAVVSQVGDLAASAIKRNHEIKDYGTLIPGHGGILDRFDSVIFTAPIIYVMAVLMMR